MNHAIASNISENETESIAQKVKHLIKLGEKIDNTWVYRLASHTRFAYWAFNILYRRRLLSQGNFFIKQNAGEANLTFEGLQEMLSSGSYSTVMSKLMHYAKKRYRHHCLLESNKRTTQGHYYSSRNTNYLLDTVMCIFSLTRISLPLLYQHKQ